jgi:ribonuclease HI
MSRKFYVDGAGTNGKVSRTCVYYPGIPGPVVKTFQQKYTNNECEYMALIDALEAAENGDIIYTDSLLMVNHLKGEYRVRARNLMPLFEKAKKLAKEKKIVVLWVPREKNLAGKHLEKNK